MTYTLPFELCKQLKEAGFPQDSATNRKSYVSSEHNHNPILIENLELFFSPTLYVSCPSLSELIEACGNRFENLFFDQSEKKWKVNVWVACLDCTSGKDSLDIEETIADSPEEAVAYLYLKINPKNE